MLTEDTANVTLESVSLSYKLLDLRWSIRPNTSLAKAAVTLNQPTKERQKEEKYSTSLPSISAAQVHDTKHNTWSDPISATVDDGVYKMSEMVELHPRWNQIVLTAGGPLEKYWSWYSRHRSEIGHSMIEELRVGNLISDDQRWRDCVIPSKAVDKWKQ